MDPHPEADTTSASPSVSIPSQPGGTHFDEALLTDDTGSLLPPALLLHLDSAPSSTGPPPPYHQQHPHAAHHHALTVLVDHPAHTLNSEANHPAVVEYDEPPRSSSSTHSPVSAATCLQTSSDKTLPLTHNSANNIGQHEAAAPMMARLAEDEIGDQESQHPSVITSGSLRHQHNINAMMSLHNPPGSTTHSAQTPQPYVSNSLDRPNIRNLFVVPDCPIQWVTVYQDKAEVCRFVRPRVSAGEVTEILFKKLSPHIDKDSIRVEVRGPATIQDVNFHTRRFDDGEMDHVRVQTDLRSKLRHEIRRHESLLTKRTRLEKQRAVLETFTDSLIGPTTDVTVAPIVTAAAPGLPPAAVTTTPLVVEKTQNAHPAVDRYDPRHMELMRGFFSLYEEQADKLDDLLMNVREELEITEGSVRELEKSLKELELRHDEHLSRELTVLVEATESGQIELYLSYVVSNAKWTPFYDVRIYNNDGNLKIVYYGLVQQATGEDWDCPQLSLSTSQPGIGGTVPDLGIQKMQFRSAKNALESPSKYSRQQQALHKSQTIRSTKTRATSPPGGAGSGNNATLPLLVSSGTTMRHSVLVNGTTPAAGTLYNNASDYGDVDNARDAANSAQATLAKQGDTCPMASTQYHVPRPPSTIPCDNEPHRVTVGIVDLQPTFEYVTAPRKSPFAYLKANMQNSSKFAFLPGLTNVYVDNVFVGKSEMGAVAPHEEFSCKLGADHGIRVNYNPMYKYKETGSSSGKNLVYTFKQVIEVKNTHERPIKLLVLDQLPLSGEDKIKVTLLEPVIKHPEKYDKTKPVRINKANNVEWDLDLQSGEQKELVLKFSIEYPSTEEVTFLDG